MQSKIINSHITKFALYQMFVWRSRLYW